MKKIILLLLVYPSLFTSNRYDLLIKNGRIVDGTGNPWYYGDVAIKDGRIVKTGRLANASAKRTINASGLMVAPGFIDAHSHIEGAELRTPTADNFIYDGVTTVITGNCGTSRVDVANYLEFLDSLRLSVNVATLVGHNDIRKKVMGHVNRAAGEEEIMQMEGMVLQAMREGAVGFSTGLIYIPGVYASTQEIIRMARAAASYNGVYATHMRSEGDSVARAIREALHIAREARIPVQISHFKVSGRPNWKRSAQTLRLVERARDEGIDVTIDQYPYTASSTSLGTLPPEEVLSDGPDSVYARLKRPASRKLVIRKMLQRLQEHQLEHFSYARVAYFAADTSLNGKSIEAINLQKGRKHDAYHEAETIIDMVLRGGASMVFHSMSEWDVTNILKYPFNMFASDAAIRHFGEGSPHPRGYGTNARVLAKYVREEKIIPLEEAVRRMTPLPARRFQLRNRGLLLPGYAADISIFDANSVQDLSTFEKPHAYSRGFFYVLVNGELVIDQSKHTGTRSGRALYRG